MGEGRVVAEHAGLPAELAATLERRVQDALNHPVRRQVLRDLHFHGNALTVTELHDRLPHLSRGGVSYHLQVLQDCGCVVEAGTRMAKASSEREMGSALQGDGEALRALEVTEPLDLKTLAGPADER